MNDDSTPDPKITRTHLNTRQTIALSKWMETNREKVQPLTYVKIAEKAAADLGFSVSPSSISNTWEALEWPPRTPSKPPEPADLAATVAQQAKTIAELTERVAAIEIYFRPSEASEPQTEGTDLF